MLFPDCAWRPMSGGIRFVLEPMLGAVTRCVRVHTCMNDVLAAADQASRTVIEVSTRAAPRIRWRCAGRRLVGFYLAKIEMMTAVPMSDIATEPRQPSRLLEEQHRTTFPLETSLSEHAGVVAPTDFRQTAA